MADKTPIEWTDATWNPVTGCSVVSPGCTNCYAMKLAGTRLRNMPSRKGLTNQTKAGPVWNGQLRFNEEFALQPLQWKRPRMIFVCAHGDLFAEGVPDEWIDRVFAVMALAPHHTFQVLTKRADRMRAYVNSPDTIRRVYHLFCDIAVEHRVNVTLIADPSHEAVAPPGLRVYLGQWPLKNVWKGVSAEDQKRADERLADLLATSAAVRWVSVEPMLGHIDLNIAWCGEDALSPECWGDCGWCKNGRPALHNCQRGRQSDEAIAKGRSGLDWVVVGGESGTGARPMHPDWARSLRDQCKEADVPFFFKQWGTWSSIMDRDNADPDWRADYANRLNDRRQDISWLNLAGGSGFHGERFHVMQRIGKAKAGRTLDGVTHDAFPKIERAV